MLKKTKILPLLFLVILLFSVMNIPVYSLSYYNWIQNGDFSQYLNVAEDGGAESGSFNSGVIYGNFSNMGGSNIVTTTPYTPPIYEGIYCFYVSVEDAGILYNFTYPEQILGADVKTFYCYGGDSPSLNIGIKIYYSDYTTSKDTYNSAGAGWKSVNILTLMPSLINNIKYIVAFQIYGSCHVDNIVFRCGGVGGQEQIDISSYPWRATGDLPVRAGLDVAVGHNEIGSGYITGQESELIQDIDYLDSDLIHYGEYWFYANTLNNIRITIVYSDGTWDFHYYAVQSGELSTWVHVIVSGCFDADKYVTQIQIGLLNTFTGKFNFDEVRLWAEIPPAEEYQRFSFLLSPTPIVVWGFQVVCYMDINYQFYGFLRNETGGYSENGTFSAIHDKGTTQGIVKLGLFNFTILARTEPNGFYETFGIIIQVDGSVEQFNFVIEWRRLAEEEIEDDVGVGGGGFFGTTAGVNLMLLFTILFVPTMVLVGVTKEYIPPHIGFVCGLAMMVAITRLTIPSLMPLWLLFVMILILGVLLFAMIRRGLLHE